MQYTGSKFEMAAHFRMLASQAAEHGARARTVRDRMLAIRESRTLERVAAIIDAWTIDDGSGDDPRPQPGTIAHGAQLLANAARVEFNPNEDD